MSLQGRSSDQAQSADDSATKGGFFARNSGGGANSSNSRMQSLIDSAPERGTLALVIFGLVIGMIIAYVVIPTEFTGASPRHMSRQAIQQWVRMVAVGHSDEIQYDDSNALLVLQQIPNPQTVVEGLANNTRIPAAERAALQALTDIPGFSNLNGALAPLDPGILGSAWQVVLAVLIVLVAIVVVTVAARMVFPGRGEAQSAPRRETRAAANAAQARPAARSAPDSHQAYAEAPYTPPALDDETERGGNLHPQYGVPVLHTVSTYIKGRNYDDSFAIELGPEQGNQFLGECGVSVATRVGNELQSVEFWGFDMASQETRTKVFAAPAALSDPALAAAVANRVQDPSADIVAAEPGARLTVACNAIEIQAEVKTVVCNYGAGTPNSGIESLQIELFAWHKQNQRAGIAARDYPQSAGSPFTEYADLEFTPPARSGSPAPPPPAGSNVSSRPSSTPQPARRPEDEEEDPFGGTGNFMPYS